MVTVDGAARGNSLFNREMIREISRDGFALDSVRHHFLGQNHSGRPRNPDEPDLEALIARAAPFN